MEAAQENAVSQLDLSPRLSGMKTWLSFQGPWVMTVLLVAMPLGMIWIFASAVTGSDTCIRGRGVGVGWVLQWVGGALTVLVGLVAMSALMRIV